MNLTNYDLVDSATSDVLREATYEEAAESLREPGGSGHIYVEIDGEDRKCWVDFGGEVEALDARVKRYLMGAVADSLERGVDVDEAGAAMADALAVIAQTQAQWMSHEDDCCGCSECADASVRATDAIRTARAIAHVSAADLVGARADAKDYDWGDWPAEREQSTRPPAKR